MLASWSVISAAGLLLKDDLLDRVAGLQAGEMPRALVVLAHPDDEVLAVGGRLERWRNAVFVTVTDGAPLDGTDAREHGLAGLDEYREARRQELHSAFADAGLPESNLRLLQLEDGSVVSDQQAIASLSEITRAILRLLRKLRPEVVLTHPYEGGHPDHDACAFAVHVAVSMLRDDAMPILEAPSYHAGPNGIVTGQFLPYPGAGKERRHVLSPAQRQAKQRRLACFTSQQETLALFQCEAESIREAPAYDFMRPPHAGALFYEGFPWGATGERFCQLASAATHASAGQGETA